MGKARRFLPVLVLFFLVQRPAIGQQPLHWDATIDSAKAAASQSNRLVLVLFCASYWWYPATAWKTTFAIKPGAVAALEANFVPVKINFDYYPNTAKQYGVTRLPTTVILAPNAQGEVLAVIPEYMPVDQYLSKLKQGRGRRQAARRGRFRPDSGQPARRMPPPHWATASYRTCRRQPTVADKSSWPLHRHVPSAAPRIPARLAGVAAPAANAAAGQSDAGHGDPGLPAVVRWIPRNRPRRSNRPPIRPLALMVSAPFSLWRTSRWQPGKKAWGAIHRGRTYLFTGAEEATPLPGRPRPLCTGQFRRRRGPPAGRGPFGVGLPRAWRAVRRPCLSVCRAKARWTSSAPTLIIMPIGPCKAMRSAAQTAAVR